jgi:DNA topoisomerase-1
MSAAQQLYEGINIKGYGTIGLITYMRTDSLRIADEARSAAAKFIGEEYGSEYLPKTPRIYKAKKGSQDAHEAIRPTVPELSPEKVKESLTNEQFKLYKLIWERFTASQMADEIFDTVSAELKTGKYIFKASGSTVKFKGFAAVYKDNADADEKSLPTLNEGDKVTADKIEGNQHFTQPPARFSEASLIKTLEENGIGRPSTYAPTITTILARGYVTRDSRQLVPTALGEVTTKLMEENFASIVDAEFTAKMESDLDKVEAGKKNWVDTLAEFYDDFDKTLKRAEEVLGDVHVKVPDEVSDVICENCGRHMVYKMGKYGKFLACPGYPECKNTKPILQDTGALCPVCGARVLKKRSKNGKTYYGCENNKKCQFMTWDVPTKEKCPKCGSSLFKKRGGVLHCLKEGCDFEREKDTSDE